MLKQRIKKAADSKKAAIAAFKNFLFVSCFTSVNQAQFGNDNDRFGTCFGGIQYVYLQLIR